MLLLLLTLLICTSPSVLGRLEESQFADDIDSDLADFDLGIVRHLKNEGVVHSCVWIFLSDSFFVHTGATQGPAAGENYTSQGKVKFTT